MRISREDEDVSEGRGSLEKEINDEKDTLNANCVAGSLIRSQPGGTLGSVGNLPGEKKTRDPDRLELTLTRGRSWG